MNEKVISKKDLRMVAIIYTFIIGLLSYSNIIAWKLSGQAIYVNPTNDSVLTWELLNYWVLGSLRYQLPLTFLFLFSFIFLLYRNLKAILVSYGFILSTFLVFFLWTNWSFEISQKIDKFYSATTNDYFLSAPLMSHSIYYSRNSFFGSRSSILSLVLCFVFILFIYQSSVLLVSIKNYLATRYNK